jgi:hypothetical protein
MTVYRTNDQTKWTQQFIDNTTLLPGLEAATGADILISIVDEPLNKISDPITLPHRNALARHVRSGLLVQVKVGRDFTTSIPDLPAIEYRMLEWSKRPWLVVVADVKRDHNDIALVDGQDSGFTWNEVNGALDWWQLRGGMCHPFPIRKSDLLDWCKNWEPRLKKLQAEKIHFVTRPTNQFIFPSDGRADILSRLMSSSFSASGTKTALKLLEYCGTLANAIAYLSDPRNEKVLHVEDVGAKRFEQFRKNTELPDGLIIGLESTEEE